jgi:polar amino acid transport system permease protein
VKFKRVTIPKDGRPWRTLALGVGLAAARRSARYVEVIRNTPLLVQVFLVYFGIAVLGIRIDANVARGAGAGRQRRRLYLRDHARRHRIRAQGADRGRRLPGPQQGATYWHVVLRPAAERVYPALVSQYVLLMLASSITSQISAPRN